MKSGTPHLVVADSRYRPEAAIGECRELAYELKKRNPDAEIWATDISAPMVRYGHWRAIQQDLDINFAQMASEALEFPDNHFDLVAAHILFHEIPRPVIEKTLAEAHRVLRPGGTFVLWDFSSASDDKPRYKIQWLKY